VDADRLGEGARRLLSEHITSVGQLEVLLLLLGAEGRWVRPASVADELRGSVEGTRTHLELLVRSGLARKRGTEEFALAQVTDSQREVLTSLRVAYRDRMHTVIDFIYSRPSQPLKDFADAFLFRKGEKDDA